jgi:hypothetical protein
MKKLYALLAVLCFIVAGFRADAACPVVISAGGPTLFCTGDSVELLASAGTGYLYQWKFNGGAISGATSISYYAKTAGNYTVTVTVVSPACTTTSNTLTVTTESPLAVTITNLGTGGGMCGGSEDILEAPFGSSYFYQWYEDNTILPNTNNYQYQTGHNGNFTVAITNTCGTYASPVFQLFDPFLDAHPYGWIDASGPSVFCTGGSVLFYTQAGFYGYQWYKDGVALPGETTSQYTATAQGSYMVLLTDYCIWTGLYSNFYSNLMTVTILPGAVPTAHITAGGPTSFCAGGNVTLNADTLAGWSYSWRKDGSTIGGATSSSYVATTSGSYQCYVYNACGSMLSNAIAVEVKPQSVTISLPGQDTICNGSTTLLIASPAGTGGVYNGN